MSYQTSLEATETLPDDVCGAVEDYNDIGTLCGKPATYKGSAGCVHEHMTGGGICDDHVERVRKMDGSGSCVHCLIGPDSHHCVIRVTVEPV